ncbi:unnamed protein product [Cylindrotheca closterium]|uniref:Uncharacterized protein n=1 Tax=Cylindrotheca closterium TaxID=2856 RepID=A0AAD2JLU7_9STRA|nr:unnamed protein product [Cylindrotheca closterium]
MTIDGEQGNPCAEDGQKLSQSQKLQGACNGETIVPADKQNLSFEPVLNGPLVNMTPDNAPGVPHFLVAMSGSRDSGIIDGSSDCQTPVSAISGGSGDGGWDPPSPATSLNLGLGSASSLMDSSSSEASNKITFKQETSNSALEAVLSVMSNTSDNSGEEPSGQQMMAAMANDNAGLSQQKELSSEATHLVNTIEGQNRSPTRCQMEISNSMPDSRNNGTATNGSEEDESAIRAALVDKRVRVVHLLGVGFLSLFSGLFASVWAQASCAFFTANIVGYAGDDDASGVFFEEKLRYGLWRYSPGGDSGVSCTSYGYDDEADATVIPRLAGVIGIMGGTLALAVLFAYLILGYAKKKIWEVAVVLAVMSGVSQLCTLLFLVVGVCEKYECVPGPGAMGTVISGFSFFILGFEMLNNMPRDPYAFTSGYCPPHERPSTILQGFEVSDISEWFRSYRQRIGEEIRESRFPSLNGLHRRRHHEDNPLGEGMLDQDMYDPPSRQIV